VSSERRWTGSCTGCHRQEVEVGSRRTHGERVLCDACAGKPYQLPSGAGLGTAAAASVPAPRTGSSLRKGSALLSPVPPGDSSRGTLHAWLQESLRLPQAVVAVERFGKTNETPVVLRLEDGRDLRFAAARDLFSGDRLVETVVMQCGDRTDHLPVFSRADASDVAQVVMRACVAAEYDDDRQEAASWQDGFTRICLTLEHGDYNDPAARWDGLRWLTEREPFDAYDYRVTAGSETAAPPRLAWADSSSYVRVIDVEAYVRGSMKVQISSAQLVARMREAGWGHRRVDARRPGAGRQRGSDDRVRASVFILSPETADVPERGVSPSVPVGDRPRPHARARVEAAGHLGTHSISPMNAGQLLPGDTSGLGDTQSDRESGVFDDLRRAFDATEIAEAPEHAILFDLTRAAA
jgi:hypothetical protein